MKNKIFIAGFIMTAIVVFVFTGCGNSKPTKSAEEVIKEGFAKLNAVTSLSYEFAMKGDVMDSKTGTSKFDFNIGGAANMKSLKDPKFTFKLKLNSELQDIQQDTQKKSSNTSMAAELRLNKNMIYFNVSDFTAPTVEVPKEINDLFKKWWKFTIPEAMMKQVESSVSSSEEGTQEENPELTKLKKLMSESNLFEKPNFVAIEDVKGEQSYHYSVLISKPGVVEFMKKMSTAQGQAFTDAQVTDLENSLKDADLIGGIWVGVKSGAVNKMSCTINIKTSATNTSAGVISFDIYLWNLNNPVAVQAPAGAEEFGMSQMAPIMMLFSSGADTGSLDTQQVNPLDNGTATSDSNLGNLGGLNDDTKVKRDAGNNLLPDNLDTSVVTEENVQ